MKYRRIFALITAILVLSSATLSVLAADWDLEQQGNLHVSTNTDYHVTSTDGKGNSITTSNTISVVDNVTTNITLDNVNISSSDTGIDVGSGANVTLNVVGDNSVTTTTSENKAAIHVSDGDLTITSNTGGTLSAVTDTTVEDNEETGSENDSAAIGSNAREDMSGNITIDGDVSVYAKSEDDGAGIGSGDGGSMSGNITIGGNAKIDHIYLKGVQLKLKDFIGTCGITVLDGTVFAVSQTDLSGLFTATQGVVSWNSETKELYIA